jgi:hypothetical protein
MAPLAVPVSNCEWNSSSLNIVTLTAASLEVGHNGDSEPVSITQQAGVSSSPSEKIITELYSISTSQSQSPKASNLKARDRKASIDYYRNMMLTEFKHSLT